MVEEEGSHEGLLMWLLEEMEQKRKDCMRRRMGKGLQFEMMEIIRRD